MLYQTPVLQIEKVITILCCALFKLNWLLYVLLKVSLNSDIITVLFCNCSVSGHYTHARAHARTLSLSLSVMKVPFFFKQTNLLHAHTACIPSLNIIFLFVSESHKWPIPMPSVLPITPPLSYTFNNADSRTPYVISSNLILVNRALTNNMYK
jgi:hypothetical protein